VTHKHPQIPDSPAAPLESARGCGRAPVVNFNAGARTTLAEEISMRNIIEDRRVLRMQFEAFAHYARHESGKPESAYCFDALAASVDDVSPELLEAYVEMFQKIEHRKIDSALRQSIQQGLWSPTSATEYMQRFIAFASGTGAPS
jgi:hypothetical protein